MRTKVEHPFRLNRQQFCNVKLRFRDLAKSKAHLTMIFAVGDLWMRSGANWTGLG